MNRDMVDITAITLMACAIAALLYLLCPGLLTMTVIYALIVAAGGIIASLKGDFGSRGMAVCFLTGPFGLYIISRSPSKTESSEDESWPDKGWLALSGVVLFILISIIT